MKKIRVLFMALALLLITPAISEAKTTVAGGPYENLAQTGQVVNLKLTGYPTGSGFYIIQCKQVNGNARPQICNSASQLWISTSLGADFAPTADIQFRPTSTFTYGAQTINCLNTSCGIFIRLDHKASSDRTEDQFIPITFVGSTLPNPNTDVIAASVNGQPIYNQRAVVMRNQSTFRIDATAKSGATLTYSTLSTTCTLSGNQVTIIQGTGFCEIDISSPGNTQYSAVTNHYLFKLSPGAPKLTVPTNVKPGTSLVLPAITSFGSVVSYELSKTKNCSLTKNQSSYVITFLKVGACTVKATSPAASDLYSSLKQSISFKIRR